MLQPRMVLANGNMTTSGNAVLATERAGAPSPERLLRDHLRRLQDSEEASYALLIHVSASVEAAQRPQVGKMVRGSLAAINDRYDIAIFQLDRDDVVILHRADSTRMLAALAERIQDLVRKACPKAAARATSGLELCRWFDLTVPDDRQLLDDFANTALAGVERRLRIASVTSDLQRPQRPLDSSGLDELSLRLKDRPITDFLRQQPAVELMGNGDAKPIFFETFVSMTALEEGLAPEMAMGGQTSLFRYLTELLDRYVLHALPRSGWPAAKRWVSVNLNLTTLASEDFAEFEKALPAGERRLVIEIQFADVLANTRIYEGVREHLKESGYRVLIDGLSPVAVEFVDLAALDADFLKLIWSRDVKANISTQLLPEIRERISRFGRDRVVLSRVDSEEALCWALSVGITRFQGFFIDLLMERLSSRHVTGAGAS